ncbi:MAG: hypothetical protein JNJ88_19955 [Planctomycetes bacterium]|nr:hypothetical protein [Planctomycetota bacterium]
MTTLTFPATSGVVAQFLGISEPQLNHCVRSGRVQPPPRVIAGRRLWTREQVLRAALALSLLDAPQVVALGDLPTESTAVDSTLRATEVPSEGSHA